MIKALQKMAMYGFIIVLFPDILLAWVYEQNPNNAIVQLVCTAFLIITLIFCVMLLPFKVKASRL